MDLFLILIHFGIIITIILILMTGFLSTVKQRNRNDAVLSIIWVFLIVVVFYFYTVTDGLIAIGLSFAYAALLYRIIHRFSSRLNKYMLDRFSNEK